MQLIAGESIFKKFEKLGDPPTDKQRVSYKLSKNSDVIYQEELPVNGRVFQLAIRSEQTKVLIPGSYRLQVYFEDLDTGYLKYILDEILNIRS